MTLIRSRLVGSALAVALGLGLGAPAAAGEPVVAGEPVTTVPSPSPTTGPSTAPPARMAGADRSETAIAVSRRGWPDGAPVVYIASGRGFADALAAAPAAAKDGGPLLLVSDSARADVLAEIDRLRPGRIVVVGGTGVVSEAVVEQLRVRAATVSRIWGPDRYATSRELAAAVFGGQENRVAWLATGRDFPDALAAGAAAGRLGRPMILVDGSASQPDPATVATLRALGTGVVDLAGGDAAISPAFGAALMESGFTVAQAQGVDRYETARIIASRGFSAAVVVATGEDYPDALTGAVLAAKDDAPILLNRWSCLSGPNDRVRASIRARQILIVGGEGVLAKGFETVVC